jgi:hypothetical protein
MALVSIQGLTWCQHAGWMLVLYDGASQRRLQITLALPDALAVGQELAGRATERSGLYQLIGGMLRAQPHPASVTLGLAEDSRARTALVIRTEDGPRTFATSTADGVALALRAGLPIVAEGDLLDAFGVPCEPAEGVEAEQAAERSEIPPAFRLALEDVGGDRD